MRAPYLLTSGLDPVVLHSGRSLPSWEVPKISISQAHPEILSSSIQGPAGHMYYFWKVLKGVQGAGRSRECRIRPIFQANLWKMDVEAPWPHQPPTRASCFPLFPTSRNQKSEATVQKASSNSKSTATNEWLPQMLGPVLNLLWEKEGTASFGKERNSSQIVLLKTQPKGSLARILYGLRKLTVILETCPRFLPMRTGEPITASQCYLIPWPIW